MTETEIADTLLIARQTGQPATIAVADMPQAYRVQRLVMGALGEIGGWKVGADGPDAPPSCAPMPASHVVAAPAQFDPAHFTQREIESEICFTFGSSLAPRDTPYTARDILAAIATCRPGLEILQSRLQHPHTAGKLALLADFIQHGAFAYGEPIPNWQGLEFDALQIRQTINGGPTIERTGNPAGDMIRLVVWLANTGAAWAGGIKAGQIVTCGSWTGKASVPAGLGAMAAFSGAHPVQVSFAAG